MDAIYEQTKTFEKVSSLSIFSVILTDPIGSPDRGERESSQGQQRLLRLQVLSDCSPQPGGVQAALSDQQTHGDRPLVSSVLTTSPASHFSPLTSQSVYSSRFTLVNCHFRSL